MIGAPTFLNIPMRHLFAMPAICAILVACATPPAPPGPPTPGAYTLALHQPVPVARGLTLAWDSVDDSRCPPKALCIWAGALVYRFSLRPDGGKPEAFELTWGRGGHAPVLFAGARVELDRSMLASPPPHGASGTSPVTVVIKPRDAATPQAAPSPSASSPSSTCP